MKGAKDGLRLFSTRPMRAYAREVLAQLGQFSAFEDYLPPGPESEGLLVTKFADGEMEVEVRPSVRGQDIYLFAGWARDPGGIPLEESKVETYHAVDALRRAQAGRITLFEPYVSAGRSDRTTRRNSVGLWVHYKTLVALGVSHMVTYSLHSDQSVSMVDPVACAMDNVPALTLLKEHIVRSFIGDRRTLESTVKREWVFCSVDAGGEHLARRCASSFGTEMVVAHKQRDYTTANSVLSTRVLSDSDLRGKTVWIVDDILDTAGSVCRLVEELRSREVRRVNVAVVHGVFSEPALARLDALARDGLLETVLVTDTVPQPAGDLRGHPYIRVVSSARLSAELVHRIHRDAPLSDLFEPFRIDRHFAAEGESLGALEGG